MIGTQEGGADGKKRIRRKPECLRILLIIRKEGMIMERRNDLMRCDILENNEAYVLKVDIPGCAKEKIAAYVEKEYLTVEAEFLNDETMKPLRKERYTGKCQRRFYVGDIKTEDVKAAYRDGVLILTIPKIAYEKAAEEKRITIE